MGKRKFMVPVTWSICANVYIEAESKDEAAEEARDIDLDLFENQEYLQDSFEVCFEDILEVNKLFKR